MKPLSATRGDNKSESKLIHDFDLHSVAKKSFEISRDDVAVRNRSMTVSNNSSPPNGEENWDRTSLRVTYSPQTLSSEDSKKTAAKKKKILKQSIGYLNLFEIQCK